MKRHRPHAFIRGVQTRTDATIARILKLAEQAGEPIPCRDGCAWCCNEPVYAARVEAQQIADRVRAMEPMARERILRELRDAVRRFAASWLWTHEQPRVFPYRALKLRCPLLTEDQRCSIYDVRPLSCRMHLARKPAEPYCSDDGARREQQFVMTQMYGLADVVQIAATDRGEYDHLIVLLANELLDGHWESGAARKVVVTK